jgi:hypothetical protein
MLTYKLNPPVAPINEHVQGKLRQILCMYLVKSFSENVLRVCVIESCHIITGSLPL